MTSQGSNRYREQANNSPRPSRSWDGAWYLRSFFAVTAVIRINSKNCECQIDSIAQSWAVISGMRRARKAMESVLNLLIRRDRRA